MEEIDADPDCFCHRGGADRVADRFRLGLFRW
jgi:hypothetical protein